MFLILIFIFSIQKKVFSYDDLNGYYGYTQYNDMNKNLNNLKFTDEEILIILDFSSSMQKKINDQPRINYAINALYNVLDRLPDNTKIGLRIFGPDEKSKTLYRTGTGINTNRDCQASKLEVPIAANNIYNIKGKLSGYLRPFGETPIGYSLRQAINSDFNSSTSLKHIVLITDGKEGCGDDPCRYITNIMAQRSDIKIDVIGISTEENAYSQLSCITNVTNGKYYVVTNIDDLYISIETAISPLISNSTKKIDNPVSSNFSSLTTPVNNIHSNSSISVNNLNNENINKRKIKYSNYVFEFDI